MTTDRRVAASGPAARPAMAADELVRLTGGELLRRSGRSIRGGAVDSRTVEPGQVFVALPGERTDGHRFLEHAARAGAAALVVTESLPAARLAALGDISVVRVADGLRALHAIAAGWRARFSPLVIGITGSIAKTSTKEAIAAVVSTRRRTLKNEGNLNNEIGLPLTILRLGPEHEAAVLEMGMYVGGEIADLARLAQPSIGVVTAVQAVHLSRIGSLDAIEAAKGELVEALPRDGIAILNADDERVARMAERTPARSLTYGFDANADVRADDVRSAGFDGMRFVLRATVRGRAVRQPVAIPGLGRLSVHNALAGAAVGLATDIDPEAVAAGLAQGWSAPHRASVRTAGNIRIVDDSYNASPGSVAAALDLLAGLPGRRVAVLGEMLELGSESARGHASVGKAAAATVDLLVVVGNGAHAIVQGARKAGLDAARIVSVEDRAAALDALRSRLRPGDVVLVKASRGVALDLLVDALVAEFGERPR